MNPIDKFGKKLGQMLNLKIRFPTLNKVVDQLEKAVGNLTNDTVKSITNQDWILV